MKTKNSPITNSHTLTEHDIETQENFEAFLDKVSDIASTDALSKQSITDTGIVHQKITIYIRDFENREEYVPVFCDINMYVDLTRFRGIHMSRYTQSLFELASKKFDDLGVFAEKLAEVARERQSSQTSIVEVVGTYMHKRTTRKSKLLSYDRVYLLSKAVATRSKTKVQIGMTVYNMTACPCTKAYTQHMIAPELKSMGLNLDQINKIIKISIPATHTQRGTTTLVLDKESSDISHKDIYAVLEKSIHLLYDMLKRPDEHDLVIRAVQKPQFTEDVARDVADNAYDTFKGVLSPDAQIYIKSILNDAIHIHDVKTTIKKTFREIEQEQ